jgi:hypothetical protein
MTSVLLAMALLLVPAGVGTIGAPDSTSWSPVPGRCLHFVYGEDPGVRTPESKADDHWVTVRFDFGDSVDFEFGLVSSQGFDARTDPGAVTYQTAVPPGSVIAWAVRPKGSARALTVREAGVISMDLASAIPPERSVEPRVEKPYFARGALQFDLDGDGLPERTIMFTTEAPEGMSPCRCPGD